ncbi:MAG: M20/M25/M40 family metallo-hydrolase [Bacteroidales bacterium]|nr:M20/M25/M40 family metallo-hydrolase [Bacteroidales bacterium]
MCSCFWGVSAQDLKAERRIALMGTSENPTWNYLQTLTGRFGGRVLGSASYESAAQWMLNEFKKMGIEAHLEEGGELPVGFDRGPWFGKAMGAVNEELHFATPSYTSGTAGRVRGHVVIEPQSERELEAIKSKVKGAWVLIGGTNSGWPVVFSHKEDSIREAIKAENKAIAEENQKIMDKARTEGKRPERGELKELKTHPGLYAQALIDAGALGFIQRSELPIRSLYDRPMINERKTTFDSLPDHCDIKLDYRQFEKIEAAVKGKQDIWLEFDIRNHFRPGPIKWHNVVATIPGTEHPEETIIISGHLDAFDTGTGAVDCGTGIGVVLGAAHMIAKSGVKPKRTIKFVAFAGEEFGLWGAEAYVKRHEKEIGKIVNLFNRDGGPTACTGISVPEAWLEDVQKIAEPMKNLWDFEFIVEKSEPRKKVTAPGGTDASIFGMKGVPCVGMKNQDYKGYGFDYGEIWHTENDILNKSYQDYMEQAATATAIMSVGMATLKKALPREGVYEK